MQSRRQGRRPHRVPGPARRCRANSDAGVQVQVHAGHVRGPLLGCARQLHCSRTVQAPANSRGWPRPRRRDGSDRGSADRGSASKAHELDDDRRDHRWSHHLVRRGLRGRNLPERPSNWSGLSVLHRSSRAHLPLGPRPARKHPEDRGRTQRKSKGDQARHRGVRVLHRLAALLPQSDPLPWCASGVLGDDPARRSAARSVEAPY